MQSKKSYRAVIDRALCVACGCCQKICPRDAIHIEQGIFAVADHAKCVGCGLCVRECPASVISLQEVSL